MASAACFSDEEIARARQLRDRATTAMELRKALSVLLVAETGLDTVKTSDILGISERTMFRNHGSIRNQNERTRSTWGGRRHCIRLYRNDAGHPTGQRADRENVYANLNLFVFYARRISELKSDLKLRQGTIKS